MHEEFGAKLREITAKRTTMVENAALATLKRERDHTLQSLTAARKSHSYLVEECNRKLEQSSATVGRLTDELDGFDLAIEQLDNRAPHVGYALSRAAREAEREGLEVLVIPSRRIRANEILSRIEHVSAPSKVRRAHGNEGVEYPSGGSISIMSKIATRGRSADLVILSADGVMGDQTLLRHAEIVACTRKGAHVRISEDV